MRRRPSGGAWPVGLRDYFRPRWQRCWQPASGDERAAQVPAAVITICDIGPLVAYLNRNDPHHALAVAVMKQVRPVDADPLFQLLEREALRLEFDMSRHWPRIRTLMRRYRQMDLADASIVVMSELHVRSQVLRIDRTDFSVYRRNDRQVIDFVAPPKR